MVKYIAFIFSILLFSGCITKIPVKPVYPFEGRYNDKTEIQIDGQKINIPKGKSVWILSNDTLYNVLDNAKKK